jgi:hypothetical protein
MWLATEHSALAKHGYNWPDFFKYLTRKIQEADPERAKIARKIKRLGQAVEGLEDS